MFTRRLIRSLAAFGLIAALLPFAGAASAIGSDHWVNGAVAVGGDTSCADPGFATISAAVTAAAVGDTINVCAGTYNETNIQITKSLTIVGDPGTPGVAGPGPSAPVIDGGNAVADAFDLADGVSDVTIEGFEIRNLGASAWVNGTGVGVQAYVPSTSNVTVSHNWFHDVGYGVLVGNDGSEPQYALGTHTGWTVTGNIAEDLYSIGFELTDTSNSIISNNVIHLGPVLDPDGYGPIGVFSWARLNQSDLTVSGNTIDGTQAGFPAIYIYARSVPPPGSAPSPNLDGVFIHNNVIASSVGASPLVEGQVVVRDRGTGTVTNVHVTNNSLLSLNNGTAATVDGTCNWWGSMSGPSGSQYIGTVTVTPWLQTSNLAGPCQGGTARGSKQAILAELQTMVPHADKDTNKKLNEAIDAIEDSLASSLWINDNELDPKKGDKVFNEERKAVQKLRDIKNPTAEITAAAMGLVEVDRTLAETAINGAPAGKDKDKAIDDFAKGDQAKNDGHLEKAVEHYRNAWKHINQ